MEGARMDPEMHGALVMVIPHPDIPILNILHQSAILLVLHTTIGITPKGNPTGHPFRIITDHKPLLSLQKMALDCDPTGRRASQGDVWTLNQNTHRVRNVCCKEIRPIWDCSINCLVPIETLSELAVHCCPTMTLK
ncbi:hypothetical protein F2P81_021911 [Scophthalmus maximus]|uniref:Uncharacterized protein n=1 Tax=Scophthalmus maximus TaxID=52904 RepID=A0A6A4S074_SCOMX|nr:hypothetical protein F2P81_021911 [Scophthalmus maximus]